jgi:hypothetical protein
VLAAVSGACRRLWCSPPSLLPAALYCMPSFLPAVFLACRHFFDQNSGSAAVGKKCSTCFEKFRRTFKGRD